MLGQIDLQEFTVTNSDILWTQGLRNNVRPQFLPHGWKQLNQGLSCTKKQTNEVGMLNRLQFIRGLNRAQ